MPVFDKAAVGDAGFAGSNRDFSNAVFYPTKVP
jgi:hypothetical protein